MTKISRYRKTLFILVLTALVLTGTFCGWFASKDRLNLIIVLVDTLRADHRGYHGYPRPTSPGIDDLAAASAVFRNHYSTASRTGPAVASVFTGLYPRSHGVINPLIYWDAKGILGDEQTTLAEILQAEGYACHGIITNPNVTGRFGFAQGFETYRMVASMEAREVNELAVTLLTTAISKPFFLYLHYMEPHSPYAAPRAYEGLFVDPGYRGPITGEHAQLDEIVAGRLTVDEADVRELEGLYDQEVRNFDDEFGRLLDALRDAGLMENTVIVFIADHGEEFLEHGSVLQGYTLYQEQLHVPFFIYDPRNREPREVTAITRHIDVLPTVLDLLGIELEGPVQGESAVYLIEGSAQAGEALPVFAEASLMAVKTIRMRSLMVDGWKLIQTELPVTRKELYHIEVDPSEQRDLASTNPEVTEELTARMNRLVKSLPVAPSRTVKLERQEIEALRSLGYIK